MIKKVIIYDIKGNKKSEKDLPEIFDSKIREDITLKYFEADKIKQPYRPDYRAGRKHSASGTISHKRHDWKGHYGKGISRVPRKTMWRRGTQFYWIGAEISGARGGRKAHAPVGIGKEKKINLKEIKIAMNSGFAATSNKDYVLKRYERFNKIDFKLPFIIESANMIKTKDFLEMIKKLFGENYRVCLKEKRIRTGRGKFRGRKYKSNAGLLLVKGKDENIKIKGIDVKPYADVSISDLYPLGRLAIYTESALKEMGERIAI